MAGALHQNHMGHFAVLGHFVCPKFSGLGHMKCPKVPMCPTMCPTNYRHKSAVSAAFGALGHFYLSFSKNIQNKGYLYMNKNTLYEVPHCPKRASGQSS
jgi:hypothetical protein